MPKTPRWTAEQAERVLLHARFVLVRSKGSHRIYMRGNTRVIVPFHRGGVLHPKIVQQVLRALGS